MVSIEASVKYGFEWYVAQLVQFIIHLFLFLQLLKPFENKGNIWYFAILDSRCADVPDVPDDLDTTYLFFRLWHSDFLQCKLPYLLLVRVFCQKLHLSYWIEWNICSEKVLTPCNLSAVKKKQTCDPNVLLFPRPHCDGRSVDRLHWRLFCGRYSIQLFMVNELACW